MVIIGNGTVEMAKEFARQYSIPFPLYTDPTCQSYHMMGWQKKFGISMKSVKEGFKLFYQGHRQGKIQGNPWQQGGEALFLPSGECWWSKSVDYAGHHSTLADLQTLIDHFLVEKGSQPHHHF